MGKVLYVEGTQDMDNGNLRMAFALLLEKELKGKMPRVIMGNGKNQTIDKFFSTPLSQGEKRYLLVDSDSPVGDDGKPAICKVFNDLKSNRKLDCDTKNTYLMIQEAEAWILSQPEVLTRHKIKVRRIPRRNVMEIAKPSQVMSEIYKDSGEEYHKVRDFSKVFPDLDTKALKEYFPEFKGLLQELKK